ncbi:TLC domain-containing protein 3A-like isoform X3 [Portunus trituberculatus]|uniref:TLC domain-containing protein 3A-like isoform X3 n=1 Tax=Portunus trituberculatus TaxID=210409 RepID=UPI001E1CF65E|nr:TLC domain-containing protein 3A-like isoform X3 [Portunus trituberculatus]
MNKLVIGSVMCGTSCFGWMGLFYLSNYLLTRYFRAKKWNISMHHTMNMSEAIVSSIQVHLASLAEVPKCLSGRVTSYLRRRTLLVLHHVVVATVLVPVLIYRDGTGDFFVGCFYCVELSGPFTNMRVVLSRLGLKTTRWYAINGILMIITFALCRVVIFPYMYFAYGTQFGMDIFQVMKKIPLHCNLGSLMVLLPQIHWLRLMVLGALKISRGASLTDADEKID